MPDSEQHQAFKTNADAARCPLGRGELRGAQAAPCVRATSTTRLAGRHDRPSVARGVRALQQLLKRALPRPAVHANPPQSRLLLQARVDLTAREAI
jgi:hypothetical protein